MSDSKVKFNPLIVKDSTDAVNEYADEFAYSSFGEGATRLGSIAFFKQVSDWISTDEVQPTRYQIANIRMSEAHLLELAEYIKLQHENSKKNSSDE